MKFIIENIPKELKSKNQWVCYRIKKEGDKTNKYMLNPKDLKFAKSNDPSTWSSFYTAKKMLENKWLKLDGLAFVLTEGYVFIDIDHSVDENGKYSELTNTLLNELPNTYAEHSCSGKGVHIICKGDLGENYKRRNDEIGLEMYQTKRFVCITGDVINDRFDILDYSNIIKDINKKYLGIALEKVIVPRSEPTMSDLELIIKIRESKQARKFDELYSGNTSGYPSPSNADFAFIRLLVFWTQDRNQLDSIFRSSGLMRDKWDKQIGDSTYGDITINNALSSYTRTYKIKQNEMY